MRNLIKDATKVIEKADDLYQDRQEVDENLNKRHEIDMNSDSWLSKNIRPITLIFAMICQLIVVIGSLFVVIDAWIVGQVGTLIATTIGFYFNSRKAEKVAAQNAKANIELEKMKTKHEIRQERKDARQERREERKNN